MNTDHLSISDPQPAKGGFSLIEVVLAIGIVAFALVSVIALLPVGLASLKHAREQAAGAACVSQIAEALWTASAVATGTNTYQASGVWAPSAATPANSIPTWSWSANSATTYTTGTATVFPGMTKVTGTCPDMNISLAGIPASTPLDQRLKAHVQIQLPALTGSPLTTGTALISVAWPNTATWNGTSAWKNADGSISSWVILLPPPPQ